MLQLRTNKYSSTYNYNYYYSGMSERLDCSDTSVRLQNHNYYFRGPSAIVHADLPLHMNGINLNRKFFCYDSDFDDRQERITAIKDTLQTLINDVQDNDCLFITGYVGDILIQDKEFNYEFISENLWTEYKDDNNIKALFNKCAEQTSLRESERQGRDIHQHLRIYKCKEKHALLMLSDYADTDQESETFLALGLVPVIFEDWKEKFQQEEIDYFKCLVNRSQVKRISNVKPTDMFQILETLEKYKDLERAIRYQTLFQKVAKARVKTIEDRARYYKNEADNALRSYDEALKKTQEFEVLADKYKEGEGSVIEELKSVSVMKGVYDLFNYNDSVLQIVLKVPLDYFDTDEAECVIRNIREDKVKRFINDIFIEQKYKLMIRVDAYYSYSTDASFQDFGSISDRECMNINAMFNPHFQFYHCLGDYKPSLIKAMRDQDLTLFVSIALAAARSMNFKDGAVCNRWFEWLNNIFNCVTSDSYLNTKCLEKDGELYTIQDWLNTLETNEEPVVIEPEDLL